MINKYVKLACEGILVVSFMALACSKKDTAVIPAPERKANLAGTEVVNANPHYTQCLEARIVPNTPLPDQARIYFKGGIAGLGNYTPGHVIVEARIRFTPTCYNPNSQKEVYGLSKEKRRRIEADFVADHNGSFIFNLNSAVLDEEDLRACPGVNQVTLIRFPQILDYTITFTNQNRDVTYLTRANGQECVLN